MHMFMCVSVCKHLKIQHWIYLLIKILKKYLYTCMYVCIYKYVKMCILIIIMKFHLRDYNF